MPTAIQHGTWSGETALLNQIGEEIPTSQVIIAHNSEQGEVEYLSTILRDISELKATEQALRDSQVRIQRITENIPGIIFRYVLLTDGSHEFRFISSKVREFCELEPEAVLQNASLAWERIHPDDVPRLQANLAVCAETLQTFNSEFRLILPHKGLRWVQNYSQVQRLDNGDVFWDGVLLDITERKDHRTSLCKTLKSNSAI